MHKATPSSGWKLASWSTGETTSTITVKMDSNKTISAKFVKEAATLYTLTVNIKGQGKVEPNGGQYEKGTVVTLTATPAEGWKFASWSTGGTSRTTKVTMDGDKTITATFTQIMYTLTVNVSGQGTVEPSGGSYAAGTVVTLTATPKDGWIFSKWSTGETDPVITVTMNSNRLIGALFTEIPASQYKLTVTISGNGSVSLDPPGGLYDAGTMILLIASPAAGCEFEKWSTPYGFSNSIILTMNSDLEITAYFKKQSGIGGRQSGPDVFFSTFNNSVFEHSWNLLKPSQQ